jgi:hypothetical protein
MKASQSLSAVMLLGALSIAAGFDVAAAKQRHHVSNDSSHDGSHGIKSFDRAQTLGGNRGDAAKNSTTAPLTSDAGDSKVSKDKGDQNAGAPSSGGPMKKGDMPAKGGPRDAGTAETGKNHVGDREDSGHQDHNAVNPGKGNGTDVGKSDIIADGPGHKTTKPSDTKKKITTIFRPHEVRDHQHPSVPGKIERNAIGVAIPGGGNSMLGLQPKVTAKVNGALAGLPGPAAAKTIPNAVMPFARHPGNNAVGIAPKTGPVINGTSVSRSGSNLTSVGGPSKNVVGALSGSSFKPKHP